MMRPLLWITLFAMLCQGCLGATHAIPKDELLAIARTPGEQRGKRVRVLQQFSGADQPPSAPGVRAETAIIITAPIGIHSHGGSAAPISAASKLEDSKWWIVYAIGLAIGLAVTEGARFDGWVNLHPMHPVHLYGIDGQYTWMPLAQIDEKTAQWAHRAYVRPSEGPWSQLERAPLNRVGWNYNMLMGSALYPSSDGSINRGFIAHIQLGYFPEHNFGILVDWGVGGANNLTGDAVYDSRTALEVQLLPVKLGILHAGVFAQAGHGYRLVDADVGQDRAGLFYGAGGLLQLELTTRLTLTARAQALQIYGETINDVTFGVSVY